MIKATTLTACALAAALIAPACSSSSSSSSGDAGAAAASLCSSDPRAQNFSANMVQPGKGGIFGVKLVQVDPWPVLKGDNAWTVQIVDAAGAPVTGATFTVKPFMPDHGHGSSIIPDIEPGQGAATFDVSHLNCFMAGVWQFTFTITKDAQTDSAVVTFCVPE
jgi:hypothetical protein